MLDLFSKIFTTLFDSFTRSKKNSDDIKRINTRLDALAETALRLEARQERAEERHKAEMRELMLRLEIILLQHGIKPNFPENQLPQNTDEPKGT